MLVLVKHATPVLEADRPPREWVLGAEGEAQAKALAVPLGELLPFDVVASREPKALRTAELMGAELRLPVRTVDGLEEIDRPAAPIVGAEEYERRNRELFEEPSRAVVGTESADDALRRFSEAIGSLVAERVVVVAHGTVGSLFVAAHNPDVDAFELWGRLRTPSYVVLEGRRLVDVAEDPTGGR